MEDLDWWRSIHADPAYVFNVPLWFVDGELASFIWPNHKNADLLVHPAHREVEAAMLAWAEAHLATRSQIAWRLSSVFRFW